MRKIREVLRLKYFCKLSEREISLSCGIGRGSIHKYLKKAAAANLGWPLPEDLDDTQLERLLYPQEQYRRSPNKAAIDYVFIHKELERSGVTLQLLWKEYSDAANGQAIYQYSQFTALYKNWKGQMNVSMRRIHLPGQEMMVDFAGGTLPLTNSETNTVTQIQIFVMCLPYSNYTFAYAVPSQNINFWIQAHIKAFAFFKGVAPKIIVDNLKSAVIKADRYEPILQKNFTHMAQHYKTAILPARVRKPKDKAKVENAVKQVQCSVLAPLRNHTFFSLEEMQESIDEFLRTHNHKLMYKMTQSRFDLYQESDLPKLQALPEQPYEEAEWKYDVRVQTNYHVEYDNNFYSVPYKLCQRSVDVRASNKTIECFYKNTRIANHCRSYAQRSYITEKSHCPEHHQAVLYKHTAAELIAKGKEIGPATGDFIDALIISKDHAEQGYRASQGVLRLVHHWGAGKLESTCQQAIELGIKNYQGLCKLLKTEEMIFESNLEPLPKAIAAHHENIRGAAYYDQENEYNQNQTKEVSQ